MRIPLVEHDPSAWTERYVAERRADLFETDGDEPTAFTSVTARDVTDVDSPYLRAEFDRLRGLDVPPKPAAMYLAGYYAGAIADFVGFGLVGARAGFLVDLDGSSFLRHPDGWIDRVVPRFDTVVPRGHPWDGRSDTTSVGTEADVIDVTVRALVDAVEPILDACRRLTRVGLVGLWNEIGDALGMGLAYQTLIDPDPELHEVLRLATRHPARRWQTDPRLELVDTATVGRISVGQKGGCCLAYTEPSNPIDVASDALDDEARDYYERFPPTPAEPSYCSTCSLRGEADCNDRQVYWHERRRTRSTN